MINLLEIFRKKKKVSPSVAKGREVTVIVRNYISGKCEVEVLDISEEEFGEVHEAIEKDLRDDKKSVDVLESVFADESIPRLGSFEYDTDYQSPNRWEYPFWWNGKPVRYGCQSGLFDEKTQQVVCSHTDDLLDLKQKKNLGLYYEVTT